MSGGRSWTTSEAKLVRELRAQRVPMRFIAMRVGRTEQAIYSFLRYVPANNGEPAKMGPLEPYPPKPKKEKRPSICDWTNKEVAKLREMAADGSTAMDVSDAIGRTVSAVRTKAFNLGVRFGNSGRHSIYRLEQEEKHFKRNAIEGSARLLNALLELAA